MAKVVLEEVNKVYPNEESIRVPLRNPEFAPFIQRVKDAKPEAVFVFLPAGEQGLQAVDEVQGEAERTIPRQPHAGLDGLSRRRADTERKATSECGLGGHGLLRHVNGMPPVQRHH